MTLVAGPQGYEEVALKRFEKHIQKLVQDHDVTYVHLQVPAGEPVDRLIIVERVDRFLLKPLTEWLAGTQPWRLTVLLDERKSGSVAFVALGTGLPQKPASRLAMDEFASGNVVAPPFGRKMGGLTNIQRAVKLARRYDAAIVPAYCLRDGPTHFVITFCPEVPRVNTGDDAADDAALVARINKLCEELIRANPDQWYMLHRMRLRA